MTVLRWRKASQSGEETNCVEVGHTLGAVRDSKNPDGPVLRAPVRALVAAVVAGRLTR